jgi:hypothetical protein
MLEEVFFNTDLIGCIGVFVVIVACVLVMQKSKGLGLVCFLFEAVLLWEYLELVESTPYYWVQIFILIFGGLLPLAFSGLKKS